MSEERNSYRQIFKSTSIFGGVRVFTILISIIRSKFVAVLLGPAGMGIAGLLNSTTGIISGLTGFGLGTSAVKDISEAEASGNRTRISIVVKVFRRWVWITGLLGLVMTLILSPWLSQITFGNRDYTLAFVWISVTLLLNQISSGQGVVLRGMRQIRYLAKASLAGSVLGLLTTVPLYYIWGLKGIVPGIIVTSVTSLLLTWYYSRKVEIEHISVSRARTIAEGKGMLKMGFMISLSGLITLGASYIVRIFISNNGGIDQVGLYNAGFAIINTYVGMIFTAMSTDYYPRLAAVAHNNQDSRAAINKQAEIAILIISPILLVFIVYINWVIILLYSTKFVGINNMILWAALGMIFKAASWPIGFIFLAKGASKVFFISELVANVYFLIFNIFGYKYFGLEGLGLSFMINYFIIFIQVYLISKIKYDFSFNVAFCKIFGFQLLLAIICLFLIKLVDNSYHYLIGTILIIISAVYSIRELDKRIDFKSIFRAYKKKFR